MIQLTTTQVAHWLGVSEKTVMRRVQDGRLPKPWTYRNRPRFSADIVLPFILDDPDVKFSGGLYLKTDDDVIVFEVVKPKYRFDNSGTWWAVFQALDGTWHVRPWKTAYVMDLPSDLDTLDLILDCRDEATPEITREELPDLSSSTWAFWKRWHETTPATCNEETVAPA
ncbi:MAG: helix-turn-helix domain-containing protein [Rhizobiaceae bacterium]|nr:MAG: helix-turn-helix domain-containing protein [Rhizobiaceae bacterium]